MSPDFAALFAWCDLHASRYPLWQARDRDPRHPFDDGYPRYFDRQGFPIPGDGVVDAVLVWAQTMETTDTAVARDELPDGSILSTVWLGLDHAYCFGPPQLFETMRFAAETHMVTLGNHEHEVHAALEFPDPRDGELRDRIRYTTEEEAAAAHHEIVRRFRLREGH